MQLRRRGGVRVVLGAMMMSLAPGCGLMGERGMQEAGARECEVAEECASTCEAIATWKREVAASSPRFFSSQCMLVGSSESGEAQAGCVCEVNERSMIILDPGMGDCLWFGRAYSCVYPREAFPGCDLAAPHTSCQSTCADLEARLDADAKTRHDVSVHGAVCKNGGCQCVLRSAESCYVHYEAKPYDCSRSAQEILESR